MNEFNGSFAYDSSPNQYNAIYEDGVAFYLPGPESVTFSRSEINRAAHFAGGRLKTALSSLPITWSVECWFWNGLPSDARRVAGYLISLGADGDKSAAGDHLGIGGTASSPGRLFFFNGNEKNQTVVGKSEIKPRSWNHLVLVRGGRSVRVYLNSEPEIVGVADVTLSARGAQLFKGGRSDNFANFEGKVDEVALYDRALSSQEVSGHYRASKK